MATISHDLKKLQLCILTPFPPKEDGVAEYSKCLVDSLSRERVSLHIVSQEAPTDYHEPMRDRKNVKALRVWRPRSVANQFRIFKEIIRIHPDIVHVQYGPCSDYGGRLGEPLILLFLLLQLARIRTVVTLHSIWHPKEAELRAQEVLKKPVLAKIASIYYYAFERAFLRLFDIILICVNFDHSNVKRLLRNVFGVPTRKIHEIVHGCIEPISLETKIEARQGLTSSTPILLCAGFIRKEKGYENVLQALNILKKTGKKVQLIVAGTPKTYEDWNYLANLRILVEQWHLKDEVTFDIRYLPQKDIERYFLQSDILLLPYVRRVGPSGPLALAASFGLAVVMTDDEKFISAHSQAAFVKVVPHGDPEALADSIRKLAEERKRERTVASALAYASKFSNAAIASRHMSLYLSALNGG